MLTTQILNTIADIDAKAWNAITGSDYPFTRHEFLSALELSQAVSAPMGWQPKHFLFFANNKLVAVMPAYIKNNSYGEYVFDFEWANAFDRHGLEYYPKLITAIPYTPATGQRLCIVEGQNQAEIYEHVFAAIQHVVKQHQLSGWHLLFPEKALSDAFKGLSAPTRLAVHFQWHNRGFNSFDDFLQTFSSRKRKNLRKERQKVVQQNITLTVLSGAEITPSIWQKFYQFYQMTYAKRSGHTGYLNQHFFQLIGQTMAEQVVLVMAELDGEYIAGALNFKSSDTLYGRYWGAIKECDHLHFEACYYQGIEYCIANKLQHFDPGVQGEHKIKRGFEPTYTYSNHYIADASFSAAIGHFLTEEEDVIHAYKQDAEQQLPFK
ncbi:MAG: N-acetyltransferase [Pseudomonadales bacterium]|nr:N-acetyltransferase [Pseudomonadales bacterium]